jgi:hypothetical protein
MNAGEIAKRILDTYPPSEFEDLARAYLEAEKENAELRRQLGNSLPSQYPLMRSAGLAGQEEG